MIKEFTKQQNEACYKPYVECLVGGKSFNAIIDTGADVTVIPNAVLPERISLKNPITIRGHDGELSRLWTKDIEIVIADLGTFRPSNGVLSFDAPRGIIGMDILNQCEFRMVGCVFILEQVEGLKGSKKNV